MKEILRRTGYRRVLMAGMRLKEGDFYICTHSHRTARVSLACCSNDTLRCSKVRASGTTMLSCRKPCRLSVLFSLSDQTTEC